MCGYVCTGQILTIWSCADHVTTCCYSAPPSHSLFILPRSFFQRGRVREGRVGLILEGSLDQERLKNRERYREQDREKTLKRKR